jgi:hypothetical protein
MPKKTLVVSTDNDCNDSRCQLRVNCMQLQKCLLHFRSMHWIFLKRLGPDLTLLISQHYDISTIISIHR